LLREELWRTKKRFRVWPAGIWAQGLILGLFICLFLAGLVYAVQEGSSGQLIKVLREQQFPLDALLLEGAPGYMQPKRAYLTGVRQQGLALGMFLLTGVNMVDARTYFLSYYMPPPQGPAWLGWAYNPRDPEREGPVEEDQAGEGSATPPAAENGSGVSPRLEGKVLVGIYHTHNAESYAGDGGPERRQGANGDVVTVGEVLQQELEKNGIGTVHSEKIHDAADFMKAYSESIKTATQILQENPGLKVLIDLHRDGLPPGMSKSTVNIQGEAAAKIMIVIGKKNPHWQKNEKIARELIEIAQKKYPGLISANISYAADARYNQHLADGALLLEFGSQLNTLQEAKASAAAFAKVLAEWLKQAP